MWLQRETVYGAYADYVFYWLVSIYHRAMPGTQMHFSGCVLPSAGYVEVGRGKRRFALVAAARVGREFGRHTRWLPSGASP